jgi:hypothetical protein
MPVRVLRVNAHQSARLTMFSSDARRAAQQGFSQICVRALGSARQNGNDCRTRALKNTKRDPFSGTYSSPAIPTIRTSRENETYETSRQSFITPRSRAVHAFGDFRRCLVISY